MKKVTKVFSVMVASVSLAAMLSGCGGDKKPTGGDTIKVGGNLAVSYTHLTLPTNSRV